jgi:hypothetical protein
MPSPGRNDPCSCGSGRKFKHCCLQALDAEDAARMRLRTAEGVLLPGLLAYAKDEFGREYLAEAVAEFLLGESSPDNPDVSREFGTTFDPFLTFSFVPDAVGRELPAGWPTEPLALHFLAHEVESCPALHREFILQACKSHPSFFVVDAVEPGRSLDIKDILTGRCFHVLEQGASRSLRPGDLLFTRVVTVGGVSILIGASAWIIPPEWHLPVIEFRERLRPRALLTREDLHEYDLEIREFYLHVIHEIQHPRLPTIQNTDGDPFELTTMTYALDLTPSEALDRLRPLATLRGEAHISEEVYDASGAITAAVLTWIKAGNHKNKDWDNTTLGTLQLRGTRLVVEVNSARRRDRIARDIAKRLGKAATLLETTVTDLAKVLKERGPAPKSEPDPDPELEALEAALVQQHWDAWVDSKVPALGNRTPRQAARTARGRERLEALLADFTRQAERTPSGVRPDVGELRRRLGLRPDRANVTQI